MKLLKLWYSFISIFGFGKSTGNTTIETPAYEPVLSDENGWRGKQVVPAIVEKPRTFVNAVLEVMLPSAAILDRPGKHRATIQNGRGVMDVKILGEVRPGRLTRVRRFGDGAAQVHQYLLSS